MTHDANTDDAIAAMPLPGILPPPMLYGGLSLHVSTMLAGSKRAIKQGNRLFVSPAMMELIRHAGEREMGLLLGRIEVIEIPEMPRVAEFALPMTVMGVGESGPGNYAARWLEMQAFEGRR